MLDWLRVCVCVCVCSVCFHCFSASYCVRDLKNAIGNSGGNSVFGDFPYLFPRCSWFAKIGKPHQTVLLSIKCSFISVGWRTLEHLVLRDDFTASFQVPVEVVSAWRCFSAVVSVPLMEQFWNQFFCCCQFCWRLAPRKTRKLGPFCPSDLAHFL